MEELDVKEINELIEKVYYIFEEYTLQEIYDINYFPPITTTDAERLEKKIKFLDTATLDNELTELKEAYSKKEYLKIIDAISPETTTRLKEIYEEKNLLEKGYNQIKKDAQQTIDKKIEENKIYKNKEIDTLIENAKEEYNKGKYLTAISLLSNATVKEPQKNQKNIQIATVGIILCIFLIMYFFFRADNSKKKKKIDYQEKRMKVIRHT
jgi:formate dehydrogenase maturation protein FdhE